jgi:uncharacterized protein
MTRDADEGLDADGVIVTGAAVGRIAAVYRPVVADCAGVLREVFGGQLHSLYIYGSVATGQARPPDSDLDLAPVWVSAVPAADVRPVAADLSARHVGVVREVSLACSTRAEVLADSREGLGMRCFLRHYCVCLTGVDLRPSLPPCAPSRAVADGLNDDVGALVRRWRSELHAARTPDQVAAVARAAARKLLLVTATLESVEHGGWTTDRATGAALLTEHHPQWTAVAGLALSWCAGPPGPPGPDAQDVRRLLDLGDWLATRPYP